MLTDIKLRHVFGSNEFILLAKFKLFIAYNIELVHSIAKHATGHKRQVKPKVSPKVVAPPPVPALEADGKSEYEKSNFRGSCLLSWLM